MNPLAEPIYSLYPLKKSPRAAEKAILKAIKRVAEEDKVSTLGAMAYLLERTKEFRIRELHRNPKLAYTKHPATWMNGDCFREDMESWGPRPPSSSIPPQDWARKYWQESIYPQFKLEFPEKDWSKDWRYLPPLIQNELKSAYERNRS